MMWIFRWWSAALISLLIICGGYYLDIHPLMQQIQALENKIKISNDTYSPGINQWTAKGSGGFMQAVQESGLRILTVEKDALVLRLVASGQYASLHQLILGLPHSVWLKQFDVIVDKNQLRITFTVLFQKAAIARKLMPEPFHNAFCLPRLLIH